MSKKLISSEEAVKLVKDGDTLAIAGFVGTHPEELSLMLEQRFLQEGHPWNLTLFYAGGQGDGKDKAVNHYGAKGFLKRVIAAHYNLAPKLGGAIANNQLEGYCFPQGALLQLTRAMADRQPGVFTRIGLKTFVDPRVEGGKINGKSKESEDLVKLVEIAGKEYLHYQPVDFDVAFIRGTTADEDGNISMEKEFTFTEAYYTALATKSRGGIVIAQVERMAAVGTIHPQAVKVPGAVVDYIVIAKPENHWQNNITAYDGSTSGAIRRSLASVKPMELTERKIIARRGVMELAPRVTLNLGVGVPDGVATVASEEGIADQITLTVEAGPYGGVPVAGVDFGAAYNPLAILEHSNMFDLYDSGALDIAYLGMAQVDPKGNVNVSKFGPRVAGCGGFINITQNAKTVVFCGTLTASGLKVDISNDRLNIVQEGTMKKFINEVEQITFSGEYAIENGQRVLYMTERAVFELTSDALVLIEIAPGVELQKDVLDLIEFPIAVAPELKIMDVRFFRKEAMGLKPEFMAKGQQ